MQRRMRSRGLAAFAGTMVVAGPVLAACVGEPSYEDWAATDGAAGRINLDDVQDAFKRSESVTEFEERVNRIYEGDGVVLIRADQTESGMTLDGFEDLDGNGEISDSADDKLFSIVKNNEGNKMQGHGANGYYNRGFGGGDFLLTYLLLSSFSGPRYSYHTAPARATTVKSQRNGYRSSSSYRNQVSRNGSYFNKQKGFAGSSYSNAGRNLSSSRQTYQSTQKSSGSFKSSSTNVRSASRFGGSSRGGGLRGGGGAQKVVGYRRGK